MKKEGIKYINALKTKSVGDKPIYPVELLYNILDRKDYLSKALELQERANGYIRSLGQSFDLRNSDPDEIQQQLHEYSLRKFSENIRSRERVPKIFLTLAGPGGAGKDTVFENTEEILADNDVSVVRINKYTTRDSSRPGAYHFREDIEDLHSDLGNISITPDEVDRLREIFKLELDNELSLNHLQEIQARVDEQESRLTEWNIELHPERSSLLEILYRRNRGWYATDGTEVLGNLKKYDVAVITGNPQNLTNMINWVKAKPEHEVKPVMIYVLPAYPSQFTSAARALSRDGVEQSDKELLSTTGARQTDEMGVFVNLVEEGKLKPDDLIILENDQLLSDPSITGKVETLAGLHLAEAILGDR